METPAIATEKVPLSGPALLTHQAMMQAGRGLRVRIAGRSTARVEEGEIRVQVWNQQERRRRGLRLGGLCWGAAVVSVFLPLLHFVLVPGFLFAGPIVFFLISGQSSVVLGGEGSCPSCRAFLPIVRTAYQFPFTDLCTGCQSDVTITPIDPV